MYNKPYMPPTPYYNNTPMNYSDNNNEYQYAYQAYKALPQQSKPKNIPPSGSLNEGTYTKFKDYGPKPFVVNIEEVTKQNNTFRTALWTGKHLQLTLMSINVGEDIGLEMHPNLDQFIRIEEGNGRVIMGDTQNRPNFQANVKAEFAIIIPAGKWHNLINMGRIPLKLYSIYAPPQHPFGTVHATKANAQAAEENPRYY
jgi:mannose-6-phosphate isomerase-like protein (cupin superfamily)